MGFLANSSIGKRLGAGFTLVLVLTMLIAGAGIWRMNSIAESTREMMAAPLQKERLIADWHTNTFGAIRRTAAIVKSSDPSLGPFFKKDAAITSAQSTELIKKIEPMLSTEQEKALFRKIAAQRKVYTETKDAAVKARAEDDADEAMRILDLEFTPAANAYEESLTALSNMQRNQIDTTAKAIDQAITTSVRLITGVATAAVVLGALCSWLLASGIVRPIRRAVALAEQIASGDLTQQIDATTRDETGALLRALRHMNDSLVAIVAQVRSGTDAITTASAEISAGNLDLSARTEQQASSLEETAASMEELTGNVRNNADNARQANQLSIEASQVAGDGGAVVGQVVATMASINESARKIVDIIAVIDGIAFQTNILALNAAVEAARAGEQGRGFAVVASEVRTLAQRSAAAAKEIKTLIDDSVGKVDAGAKLVDQAGATMEQVVASIHRVTGIMAGITSASQEQTSGIEQVNEAIGQMDQVTQQNAALVEEAAAAASSMQDQAAQLAEAVDVFKLDRHAGSGARSAPARAVLKAAPRPARAAVAATPGRTARAVELASDWEAF